MRVRFSARSDVGLRREVNQDAYGTEQLDQATLLIVCDGMGGHAAGEVASQLGVQTITANVPGHAPSGEALRNAFSLANERIYAEGRGSMGTTGVAALFLNNTLYVANVGDSRAYLVREGQIRQISQDHSFVSDQVAAGLMTPEQARTSNIRNIITRALGYQPEVEVDLFTTPVLPGDTVLLSSDGMHGLIDDREIAEIASMLPPDQAAQRLVDTANERGGTDNITVVIAQVDELDAVAPDDQLATRKLSPAPEPQHIAEAVAPTTPAERPLTRLGLLLSGLTLLALIGLGAFLIANVDQRNSSNSAPIATATSVTGTPAPVTSPTLDRSPALAPTGSATAVPARSPQPRPASPSAIRTVTP